MRLVLHIIAMVAVVVLFSHPSSIRASECKQNPCNEVAEEEKKACLEAAVTSCQSSLSNSRQQQQTLQNAIEILNGSITLQQIQIDQTLYQINSLQKEIDELGSRIGGLNISLDQLGSVLVERVGEQYKRTRVNPVFLILKGNSLNGFMTEYKYLKQAKKQTLEAMQRAETQRILYDEQKNLKEVKQTELQQTQDKLVSQQTALSSEKQQKANLLAVTQHEEGRYQSFLNQAQAELASFRRFVSIQGGASILSGQTSCDDWGCYYNQRDSQWGDQTIGSSNETMKEVGCLITSMAMISTHYGKNLTPAQIAASSSPFYANTPFMWLGTWSVNSVTTTRTQQGGSLSLIDAKVEQGIPVIVGLNTYGDSNIDHFIVVKAKEDGEYIMNDPYLANGHDAKLTDHYPLGAIARVDYVTVN